MTFMLLKTRIRQMIASALLMSVIACTPSQQSIAPGKVSASTQAAIPPNSTQNTNLIALLLVKKDNLKNEFRAEVYPIALMLNGRYVEISHDVTQDIRNNAARDRIIEVNNQRIVLNAIKDFAVISNHQKLSDFQVEKPVVGQYICSAVIVGQGNFQDQTSSQTVFDQIPKDRSSGFKGYVRPQEFDETWRTAIAVSQPTALSKLPAASEVEFARYRQDVLGLGKAAIAQVAKESEVLGEAVVESIRVVDLDRNGSPEIFGKVRQGTQTQATSSQRTPTGSASIWMTYKDDKPQVLETTQASVSLLGSQRSPYDLLETLDLNGDGIDEVIAKRTDYEYTGFEIYEYKNNKLERVFKGAGYGC